MRTLRYYTRELMRLTFTERQPRLALSLLFFSLRHPKFFHYYRQNLPKED